MAVTATASTSPAMETAITDDLAYLADMIAGYDTQFDVDDINRVLDGDHAFGHPTEDGGVFTGREDDVLYVAFDENLADHVGGEYLPGYVQNGDGTLLYHTDTIRLNPDTFDDTTDTIYSDIVDAVGGETYNALEGEEAFVHELVHAMHDRYRRESDHEYDLDAEQDTLLYLEEAQNTYNVDGKSYEEAEWFYQEFLDRLPDEDLTDVSVEDAATVLQKLNDEYVMLMAHGTDPNGDDIYQPIFRHRDQIDDSDTLEDEIAATYGMPVDELVEIDYDADAAEKYAAELLAVQQDLVDGYQDVLDDGRTDLLPDNYGNAMPDTYTVAADEE